MSTISSSLDCITWASKPGTIQSSSQKATNSLHSLKQRLFLRVGLRRFWTYWAVSNSRPLSSSSPSLAMPLVIKVWTLQKACTTRPKWHPWWTRGSCIVLKSIVTELKMGSINKPMYRHFLGPNSNTFTWGHLFALASNTALPQSEDLMGMGRS